MELVRVNEVLPEIEAIKCSLANAEVSVGLEEEVREALKDLKRKGDQWRPFEDLHTLMLRINDHIGRESSEQKSIYHCLRAIEQNTKETINAVKIVALFISTVAGLWSAVVWWIWRDEIRAFAYEAANPISHHLLEFFRSMH